jgi:hypothetical protein
LVIRGDAASNNILIEPAGAAPQAFRITGQGGTLINGQAGHVDLAGVTVGLQISMGRGNDTVFLSGGTQALTIPGFLSIRTDGGDDTVWLDPLAVSGRARINAGRGSDVVAIIDALLAAGLKARTKSGADSLSLCGVTGDGPVRLGTGRNADTVVIDDSVFNDRLAIGTGSGSDTVELERHGDPTGPPTIVKGKARIRTRGGNDKISIGKAGEQGNSVQFLSCSKIKGGSGFDTLDAGLGSTPNANGNTFGCKPVVKGIEKHLS